MCCGQCLRGTVQGSGSYGQFAAPGDAANRFLPPGDLEEAKRKGICDSEIRLGKGETRTHQS